MSKEEILTKVRKAIADRKYDKVEVQKAKEHIKNDGDLMANFISNLIGNKNEVIITKAEELHDKIAEILKTLGTKNLLVSPNLGLDTSDFEGVNTILFDKAKEELHDQLFECDTSIIKAKYGVSNFGAFCLSSDDQPRLMSLVPQNCIILIKKESVLDSFNDVLHTLKEENAGKMPTNVIFVAGPSRTADIELIVVIGVHGPQKVYGVIY